MGDKMRPVPFRELLERIFTEYRNQGTIFGIRKEDFYKGGKNSIEVFGQKCTTPLGPAAGPHTQLAQNIVSSYLVGGRFIELKTVQIMDYLGEKNMIAKPCIDARDEGHNVEWSTEYTLPKAYDEYLKAWFAVHVIQAFLSGKAEEPDFVFNMSVGYNLEGIKEPKMQTYINCMMDAKNSPLFEQYKEELKSIISEGSLFEGKQFEGLEKRISSKISPSVTISTMHGCPPKEIEAICTYMISEKKLNTFVKLNPTLLGYDKVREILDKTGFTHVQIKKESFEHDLQYSDAVSMLHRLIDLAAKNHVGFGVKLTNTLGNFNDGSVLPGDERYMSGRALLPISTAVAAKLSEEFEGKLPVSYSGGATAYSVKSIFDTGIRPITLATDMLKPGGYARLKKMAQILDKESKEWGRKVIDPKAVKKLSEDSASAFYTSREFRGENKAKTADELPMFNCYVSPCKEACPIHQDIPDYVSLVGEGKYAQALALIYRENALPNITCNICDHQCQNHCARMDYEGPVQIREMKKIAVEQGSSEYMKLWKKPQLNTNVKAAVVGAGPAGLAAAYFLARAGVSTTVFEKAQNAGGVVANIIPSFRIDPKAVEADVKFIEKHGVKFNFGCTKEQTTVKVLKDSGYDFIYYAIGSEKDNVVKVEGDSEKILGSLDFLESFKAGTAKLGKNVVVTGGGNTAMDCARAAKRCKGVESVTVVYRRTEKEMPADPEEYTTAKNDGISFLFLANPKQISGARLVCTKMVLGEPDASGRRKPIETEETAELACDNLITAIGEHADAQLMTWYGIECNDKGWPVVDPLTNETPVKGVFAIGDMASGPSTVVRCIASARKAVEATLKNAKIEEKCECFSEDEEEISDDEYAEAEDRFYSDIQNRKSCVDTKTVKTCKDFEKFAKQEAGRCMDCAYLCNKCVEVCPNRANVPVDMRFSENSDDPFQILHIDAYCNECGNCATFCNHMGKPYKDKFTLFSREDDFENSTNSGFIANGEEVKVRLSGKVINCTIDGEGQLIGNVPAIVKDMIEQVFVSYGYLLGRVDE